MYCLVFLRLFVSLPLVFLMVSAFVFVDSGSFQNANHEIAQNETHEITLTWLY